MRTFAINTLGCKVNQYESQQIRELLEKLELNQVAVGESPDYIIVNTCCVTSSASARSRQCIRKAKRLNPGAIVIVCGCLPTVQLDELNKPGKNVYLITHRQTLATSLTDIIGSKTNASNSHRFQSSPFNNIKAKNHSKSKLKNNLKRNFELPPLTSFADHTRAFLKIQDGCDGFCSYCIIPKTRPYVRSKPPQLVIQEAQALVEAGHKEIVLTGVFLGAYGRNTVIRKQWDNRQDDKLAQLLDKMAQIPNLARIRLSSLEPADVTLPLLDIFCKHRNIMPHLHLSMQSGSDAILKKMRRQYNIAEFKEKIGLIKSRLDRPALTADIIVGFPGETDEDFEATKALAREAGFAKMHIFPFSARKGTAAAKLQPLVNNKVIKERKGVLHNLDAELAVRFRQQFIGETETILVERDDGRICGRSERYFMVYLDNDEKQCKQNDLVTARLVENTPDGATGKIERKLTDTLIANRKKLRSLEFGEKLWF